MCTDTYVLSEAAKLVANAEFALRQKLCQYGDLSQKRYALQMLQARGDMGAVEVLLRFCPELAEAKEETPPLGIAAD